VPPVLTQTFRHPGAVLAAALGGDSGPVIAELERAFRVHPDAFFAFVHGVLAANARRMEEAERAFLAAADATSLVPIKRGALFGAVFCQWELADQDPAARREQLARAVQTSRRLIASGRLTPVQAALVASVAAEAGEFDLARGVIADWERQAPEDVLAWRKRLDAEFRAGAYGPAVAAADRILKRLPDDESARRFRAAAAERLADAAKKARPRPPARDNGRARKAAETPYEGLK
jgi:tetratricopeptide (TPR) repeat protein